MPRDCANGFFLLAADVTGGISLVGRIEATHAPAMWWRDHGYVFRRRTSRCSQLASHDASKPVVLGLVKSAAFESASAGIRVNAIHPGPVATHTMDAINQARGVVGGAAGLRGAGIPLQRYGTPDEVAAMTASACRDEGGFSTGSSFLLNCGIMAGRG